MDFSITQLSPSINQANLATDFGVAMLAKTMNNNEKLGQNLANMIDSAAMERSVNPSVGSNFDLRV
ncbi:MAG: YjfB family protein [Lachnospiraceae bacterium]|nr:YjfB family protein [Lachnospiraceae bacterium]